jgi:hypothetical protein
MATHRNPNRFVEVWRARRTFATSLRQLATSWIRKIRWSSPNAVATIVVARWEGALDVDRARRTLDGPLIPADADETKLYAESSDVDDRGAARHLA